MLVDAAVIDLEVFGAAVNVAATFKIIGAGLGWTVVNAGIIVQLGCGDRVVSKSNRIKFGSTGLIKFGKINAGRISQNCTSLEQVFGGNFFGFARADVNDGQHVDGCYVGLAELGQLCNSLVSHPLNSARQQCYCQSSL